MFLIAYSMDPKHWRRNAVELARDDGILEAIIFAFTHHTRQAIHRGLLRGYRGGDDALNTVRGRIRFGDQIQRRFDIPLPVEVAFDEFTEDIEKNRLLRTAIDRLGHTFIRSEAARAEGPPPPALIGSPAHAGIDRRLAHMLLVVLWFPRPRGDRPGWKPLEPTGPTVPPPTRG